MPLVFATRAKCCPNFLSLSRIRYLGICPYGVASRNCCATQGSVGARVTFTCMTFRDFSEGVEKGKQRTEEEIGDLQEITGPHQGSHDCGERSSKSVHERVLDGSASYTSEWSVYSRESPT